MSKRAQLFGGGVLALLGVTACPVTDDYFIEASRSGGGEVGAAAQGPGGAQALAQAGKAQGGLQTAQAGSQSVLSSGGTDKAGSGTLADGGSLPDTGGSSGGSLAAGQAGDDGLPMPCVSKPERCNGYDDDCDGSIDEQVCDNSQLGLSGCIGIVTDLAPRHGYMLCSAAKDPARAKMVCQSQAMRLAWLESAAENDAIVASLKKLGNDTDILFGATDSAREGYWYWDGSGGFQFWQGNDTSGKPVNGAFNGWGAGAPNDANNEDCIILNSATGGWGDRSCYMAFAFLCEEP